MLEFKKVNQYNYITDIPGQVSDMINKMLDDLSVGNINVYEDNLNKNLFDLMLCRYVSTVFFNTVKDVNDIGFTIVDCNLGNRVISVSLGKADFGPNGVKHLSGVQYK